VPGLVRKQFLCSKDCRTAGGVYLWNDERAARAFMNERVAPMIREKFHVDPTIEFMKPLLFIREPRRPSILEYSYRLCNTEAKANEY